MIIKSFTAESAAAALKQVKHAMGGNAVVLKTRQVRDPRGGLQVEVTALLDNPTVAQTEDILAAASAPSESRSETNRLAEVLEEEPSIQVNVSREAVTRALNDADFSASYADYLIEQTVNADNGSTDTLLALSECLTTETEGSFMEKLELNPGDKLVVVGPTGSGKTSLIGKLATRLLIEEQQKVRLITLDTLKLGAADEIQNYADLLGLEVGDFGRYLSDKKAGKDCVTLIDTSALSLNEEDQAELIRQIEKLNVTHTILCLSATSRGADLEKQIENYRHLNLTGGVMTMTDLSWRYGAALSAFRALGLKLVGVTDNPGGIGNLHRPTTQNLTNAMLQGEVYHEPSVD
jgi:flagellar biosynthesis GTPase FlhF